MKQLSSAEKEAIVRKVLTGKLTVIEAASQNNIGRSTVSRWVKTIREGGTLFSGRKVSADIIPSWEHRLAHLQATFAQDSVMIDAYCRQHGLHPHQLIEWKTELLASLNSTVKPQNSIELRKAKFENKKLKKDIVRKDKVIAETEALLVLKQKMRLIFEEKAGD